MQVQNTATKRTQGLKKMLDKEKWKTLLCLTYQIGDGEVMCKNFHLQTIPVTKGLFNQKSKGRTEVNACKLKPDQFKWDKGHKFLQGDD